MKYFEQNITEWENYGFNYWGITKCYSTSIKSVLIGSIRGIHSSKQATYISKHQALCNGLVNITVMRDPLPRFKSMFKDIHKRPSRFIKYGIVTLDDFFSYLETKDDDARDVHFRTQHYCIHYEGDLIPTIYTIESIQRFFEVPHLNAIPGDVPLTSKQIEKVKDIYKDDFLLWDTVLRR